VSEETVARIRTGIGLRADTRVRLEMPLTRSSATEFVPNTHSLPVLREAVQNCRGCDLYKRATQAVLGEMNAPAGRDSVHAEIMLIGEQPGDKEDLAGRPFVGPAGKLLDRCMDEAGIDRKAVYITNAVKHFKWEPRGKLRLHKKPSITEIHACRPWLDAEIDAVKPKLIVCLGATAAQSLLGSSFRITASHGTPQHVSGYPPIVATSHPASILRAQTDDDRHRQMESFIDDLRAAMQLSHERRVPRAA
jgi:uracil-DNA glycosylase